MSNLKFAIIPKPAALQIREGCFEIGPETRLRADEPNQENAGFLRDLLAPPVGRSLPIQDVSGPDQDTISLVLDPQAAKGNAEGYTLDADSDSIWIRAATTQGVFYGLQTLRQLLPVEIESLEPLPGTPWQVPCCRISDQPRFSWRGHMLDEGRHFHGMQTVIRTIDLMAAQKLNILHWHLTEDQGWRIEIKRYPRLTEIGSRRAGTARSRGFTRRAIHDGVPHSGYYTQGEIRQVVAYAARRGITIVPEIELPGHALAALAAYPDLSCSSGPFQVATRFGIFKDVYCPGKESTFEFLQNVLGEVMALFPGPIIHIGGDEVPKARWQACPDCQRRIRDENLKDVHALQVYTTNRIARYLHGRGRRLMGWNQILGPELRTDALVQYWIGNKGKLLKAIRDGQQVVNSAYMGTYLDHSYALTSLRRAYCFDPVFPGLGSDAAGNILGLEAPLWTEWVPDRARLDYQTYPRLTAFAEVGWTPRGLRDYADFRARLGVFLKRLDHHQVGYAPVADWDPPWYRRVLGPFTIARPQWKTAGRD